MQRSAPPLNEGIIVEGRLVPISFSLERNAMCKPSQVATSERFVVGRTVAALPPLNLLFRESHAGKAYQW